MVNVLKSNNFPEPIFEENGGGFQVTFLKDLYTEAYLKSLGLNERQISAVVYLEENNSIFYTYYHCMAGCKTRYKADEVNEKFEQLLNNFSIKAGIEGIDENE